MRSSKLVAAAIFAVVSAETSAKGRELRTRENDLIRMMNTCIRINQLGEYDRVLDGIDLGQWKIPKGFESLILPAKVVVDPTDVGMKDLVDRKWLDVSPTRYEKVMELAEGKTFPEEVKKWQPYDPNLDSFSFCEWERFWNRFGQDVNRNQLSKVSVSEIRTVKSVADVIANSMVDGKMMTRLFSTIPVALSFNFFEDEVYAFKFDGAVIEHWVRGVLSTYIKTIEPNGAKDD